MLGPVLPWLLVRYLSLAFRPGISEPPEDLLHGMEFCVAFRSLRDNVECAFRNVTWN